MNSRTKLVVLGTALLFGAVASGSRSTLAQSVTPRILDEQAAATVQDNSQRGSLMRVPQSAGLYLATMNHQAMVEAVTESNAWQSIKSSDVSRGMKKAYRRGRTRGYGDYNEQNPFAQYLKGYGESIDNIAFQSVWQIAKQVVDNEMFLYVDNDVLPVLNEIQAAQAQFIQEFGFDPGNDELTEQQQERLATMITEAAGRVECPTMIMGSRLENPDGFRGILQLARSAVEQGMRSLPAEMEIVQDFWKVVDDKENYLLMADVDLSKIPWKQLLAEIDEPDQRRMAESIIEAIAGKQATIAMGIVDNLLVFGIAKDQQRLTDFGAGEKLVDLTNLKPLRSAIDRNESVLSVFYMSDEYAKASYSFDRAFEQLQPMLRPILQQIDEIPDADKEQWATRIETEAKEFISDMQQIVPEPGMMFGYASLHDDGIHAYSRAAYQHPMVDGSKTLNLVTHADANTIAFFSQRLYRLTDQYDLLAKWSSRFYGYGRDFALEKIEEEMTNVRSDIQKPVAPKARAERPRDPAEADSLDDFNRELTGEAADGNSKPQRAEVEDPEQDIDVAEERVEEEDLDSDDEPDFETIKSFIREFETIVKRFDQTSREKLLPAIDGQEAGLFLESVSGPNPWHPEIPVAKQPLPLPLPAIVIGTNDAKKSIAAGVDYWSQLNSLLDVAREHFPDEDFDEIMLLPPDRTEANDQVSFRWNLLFDYLKIDPSVQTGSLISDNWMVLNFHPDQAKSLTMPHADRNVFGPADTDEPSIGLAFYDHRLVMRDLRAWIDFGETQIPADENPFNLADQFPAERDTLQFTEPQLRDWFERVWSFGKCWQGVSIRTYEDGDGMASEYLFKFQDVGAE